jgi:hypothetical protein
MDLFKEEIFPSNGALVRARMGKQMRVHFRVFRVFRGQNWFGDGVTAKL